MDLELANDLKSNVKIQKSLDIDDIEPQDPSVQDAKIKEFLENED